MRKGSNDPIVIITVFSATVITTVYNGLSMFHLIDFEQSALIKVRSPEPAVKASAADLLERPILGPTPNVGVGPRLCGLTFPRGVSDETRIREPEVKFRKPMLSVSPLMGEETLGLRKLSNSPRLLSK